MQTEDQNTKTEDQTATPSAEETTNETPVEGQVEGDKGDKGEEGADTKVEGDSFLADEPDKKEGEEENFAAPEETEALEYELELPDDSLVPDEEFDKLVEDAQKEGLTKEEAEARLKLLDSAYVRAKDEYIRKTAKEYRDELFSDPEFDTDAKRKQAKADIELVYQTYKDPEFIKFMKSNPLIGNNKHIVKFLANLGRSIRPEGAPKGADAPAKVEAQAHPLATLYPHFFDESQKS